MKNYYYILGVGNKASELEIRKAYKSLATKLYPNKNSGENFLDDRFTELQEAYETLVNEERRNHYDIQLNQFKHQLGKSYLNEEDCYEPITHEEENKIRENEIRREFEEEREKDLENSQNNSLKGGEKGDSKRRNINGVIYFFAFWGFVALILYGIGEYHKYGSWGSYQAVKSVPAESQAIDTSKLIISDSVTVDTVNINDVFLIPRDSNRISFVNFPSVDYYNGKYDDWKDHSYIDLDNDGTRELLVKYYTGGAHCCYNYSLYKKLSTGVYREIFVYEGGTMEVTGNSIILDFSEQIGYFYACYACYLEDMPNKINPHLSLVYTNGKFSYSETSDLLNKQIVENLSYLKSRGISDVDTGSDHDDGTRKEFASNIITYYYNNHGDSLAAWYLFNAHYEHTDKYDVWELLIEHINSGMSLDVSIKYYMEHMRKVLPDLQQ